MKILTLACLVLLFSACKKFDGGTIAPNKNLIEASHDTIPDNASFTLKLSSGGYNYDETEFVFDHKAKTAFDRGNDAIYFSGFGQVSLASISSDGQDMAIYELPYHTGISVGLDVHCKKDAELSLSLEKVEGIPPGIRVWVKDTYGKDSLDLCKGPYSFRIDRADTNSSGGRRLKLILMSGPPMYWSR